MPITEKTSGFYDDLMAGRIRRGILGKDQRYNPLRIIQRDSTQKYFVDRLKPYLKPTDKVLDFGCGPGAFLGAIAPCCGSITGVDITAAFVSACRDTIEQLNLGTADVIHIQPGVLPFEDHRFDVVVMVDVIHHLDDVETNVREVRRVLKPGGQVFIFEPNKLNPLIYLVHAVDRNEWGLLRLGSPRAYRRVLRPFFRIEEIEFNGIVIGPESRAYTRISDLLNAPRVRPWLGWLNPKMFIRGVTE